MQRIHSGARASRVIPWSDVRKCKAIGDYQRRAQNPAVGSCEQPYPNLDEHEGLAVQSLLYGRHAATDFGRFVQDE